MEILDRISASLERVHIIKPQPKINLEFSVPPPLKMQPSSVFDHLSVDDQELMCKVLIGSLPDPRRRRLMGEPPAPPTIEDYLLNGWQRRTVEAYAALTFSACITAVNLMVSQEINPLVVLASLAVGGIIGKTASTFHDEITLAMLDPNFI
jgi:hypothetical protein